MSGPGMTSGATFRNCSAVCPVAVKANYTPGIMNTFLEAVIRLVVTLVTSGLCGLFLMGECRYLGVTVIAGDTMVGDGFF